MPRAVSHFLAPVCFVQETDARERRRGLRTVGLSSVVACHNPPLGTRFIYPAPQVVLPADCPDADPTWERLEVAIVPWDRADRTRIYAYRTYFGSTRLGYVKDSNVVVPAEDAKGAWERQTLVMVPSEVCEAFGADWCPEGAGSYYPADYRVTAEISGPFVKSAPRTWVEYRPVPGAPYPVPGYSRISEGDRIRHRKQAQGG